MVGMTDSNGYLKISLGSGGTISGDQTFTGSVTVQGNLTFGDAAIDTLSINGAVNYDTGAAIVGTKYEIQRDADATNQLHFNVPTGAQIAMSVNDVDFLSFGIDASGNAVLNTSAATSGNMYVPLKTAGNELSIGTGSLTAVNLGLWTSLSNSGQPAFLMRYGAGGTRSLALTGDYTYGQVVFGISGVHGEQLLLTDLANAALDHDNTVQTNPMFTINSVLSPNTDNGEHLNISYLGIRAGSVTNAAFSGSAFSMETDRATYNLTISSVNAFVQVAASSNPDGSHLILEAGNANTSDTTAGNGGSIRLMPGKHGALGNGAIEFYDNKVDQTLLARITGVSSEFFIDTQSTTGATSYGYIASGTPYRSFRILSVPTSVNYWEVSGIAASGAGVKFAATGSDTNVNGLFTTKGTGSFTFTPGTGLNHLFNYQSATQHLGHIIGQSGGYTVASNGGLFYAPSFIASHTLTLSGNSGAIAVIGSVVQPITITSASGNTISVGSAYAASAPTVTDSAAITSSYAYLGGLSNLTISNIAGSSYATFGMLPHTATLSTTTQITATCGVASAYLDQITVNQSGGAVTVDAVSSLYIKGPLIAGASVTLTNNYAAWIDAGLARLDGGVIFGTTSQTTLANYEENTFTPTVTLVGGAGNTVPVYSTNTGRYTRIGRQVFVDVLLNGDGGDEGAGTGIVNIALPIAASASHSTGIFQIGYSLNGATEMILSSQINGAVSTVPLYYWSSISATSNFTGAQQNNTTRNIRLKFHYEV